MATFETTINFNTTCRNSSETIEEILNTKNIFGQNSNTVR